MARKVPKPGNFLSTAEVAGHKIREPGFDTERGTSSDLNLSGLVRGTLVKTIRGEQAVEDLQVGDLILSADSGHRPVIRILSIKLTRTEMLQTPRLWPIKISAGALGPDRPERDLLVSQQYLVLVSSESVAQTAGHHEILIAAKTLLGLPGVSLAVPATGAEYHQIGFERHELMWTNGVLTGNPMPAPQDHAATPEGGAMLWVLPASPAETTRATRSARPVVLDNSVVLPLISRHVRSGAPLVARG